ncbi:MAG: hypothetical protein L3J97_07405 [Thermoplasmata archaeon]|nr:hypothetical protein [Thermoplasmata archaeon]
MTFSRQELEGIHALERLIRDSGVSIQERRRAIAALAEFGEDARRILVAISVGQWLQPLPGELRTEAARCARQLGEPNRRRRERLREKLARID